MLFVDLKWQVDKAEYILEQSQNEHIAISFVEEIERLAAAYSDGKFHLFPLKNGHSVKF